MPVKHQSRRRVSAEDTPYPVGGGGTPNPENRDTVVILVGPVMVVVGVVGCGAGLVISVVVW